MRHGSRRPISALLLLAKSLPVSQRGDITRFTPSSVQMNGPDRRMGVKQGCKPRFRNDDGSDYMAIVQGNEIEEVVELEAANREESGMDRRQVVDQHQTWQPSQARIVNLPPCLPLPAYRTSMTQYNTINCKIDHNLSATCDKAKPG